VQMHCQQLLVASYYKYFKPRSQTLSSFSSDVLIHGKKKWHEMVIWCHRHYEYDDTTGTLIAVDHSNSVVVPGKPIDPVKPHQ